MFGPQTYMDVRIMGVEDLRRVAKRVHRPRPPENSHQASATKTTNNAWRVVHAPNIVELLTRMEVITL